MKRNQVVDAQTGRVDLRYNPMSIDEDYFIPVRGDVSSRVENLPGGTYTGDIDDVKYLRDKLFSALKVPPSYLSQVEGAEEDKTTLAQKDIRFARTIQRLQRSVVTELEKIGLVHLYVLGFRGQDLTSFKLKLSNPSKIAELQELEHWKVKFDTASAATEGFFSKRWIATRLFSMSEDEYLQNQREMFYDRKLEAALEIAGEQEQAELMPGSAEGAAEEMEDLGEPGGEPGGDLEGDLGGGEGGEEAGGDEDDVLLAAPGKRDDSPATDSRGRTAADRRKEYTPVKRDKRVSGARKRSYNSKYSRETGSSTKRNVFKGSSFDDLAGLNSISKGIYEDKPSNYDREEKLILEINSDMLKLIENLEKRKNNETKTQ